MLFFAKYPQVNCNVVNGLPGWESRFARMRVRSM